jgi:hypothetical protein
LTREINGKEASAAGTDYSGRCVTPRASAFRESNPPVLRDLGRLLTCGIANIQACGD